MDDQVDVDALLAEANSPAPEIPMGDEPAPTPQAAPTPESYTIKVSGKDITATKEQLIQWAQQGYDYPQKMQAFKAQQTEFENKYKPYTEMDEYVRQNPEWWQHTQKAWESRNTPQNQTALDPNNPLTKELTALRQELADIKQFKDDSLKEKKQQTVEKQDQELNGEIKSMREQYAHLDWNGVNEQGYDLESQVIAYANQRGISNFTDAFKAYNLDRIMSIAQEKAKESAAQQVKKNTKLGLLGNSSTPQKREVTPYVKGKSDAALLHEALEELGIAN